MQANLEYQFGFYQSLRLQARAMVVRDLNKRIKTERDHENWRGITLASIDEEAIQYAMREWPRYYSDTQQGIGLHTERSWEHLFYAFMNKPANFNIAVWQIFAEKTLLRGLALGDCSHGKAHLNIRFIERSYAPDYFKGGVLLPILASAEQYAKLLECKSVFIREPHKGDEFEQYGYKIENENFLGRRCLKKDMF